MDCERCREVVSADLDREARGDEVRAAHGHLDGCPSCRHWVDRAATVTRRTRTQAAEQGPDLVDGVLHALDHGWPAREDAATTAPSVGDTGPGRRLALLVDGGPGSTECGCSATCACGCRQGRSCRCDDHCAA